MEPGKGHIDAFGRAYHHLWDPRRQDNMTKTFLNSRQPRESQGVGACGDTVAML